MGQQLTFCILLGLNNSIMLGYSVYDLPSSVCTPCTCEFADRTPNSKAGADRWPARLPLRQPRLHRPIQLHASLRQHWRFTWQFNGMPIVSALVNFARSLGISVACSVALLDETTSRNIGATTMKPTTCCAAPYLPYPTQPDLDIWHGPRRFLNSFGQI